MLQCVWGSLLYKSMANDCSAWVNHEQLSVFLLTLKRLLSSIYIQGKVLT